jgi:triosephosphate isomerase (TIM)
MNARRRPLIAGNWKMHLGGLSGIDFARECAALAKREDRIDLLIAPPATALAACAAEADESPLLLAGQNVHTKDAGAFTGEISVSMLRECGCSWVIVGHSERRQLFAESDRFVAEKVHAALAGGLHPIVCVGETLQEREAGETLNVVARQLKDVLPLLARVPAGTAIAYEPVWAIGTGKTAGPSEAETVHAAIRGWLQELNPQVAERTRILYGGSVKADNAAALLDCPNIDGALIGGASLELASFSAIAEAAATRAKTLGHPATHGHH